MTDQYTCASCHQTFDNDWSDEEALAEMRANYGDVPEERRRIVCEDCFNAMLARGMPGKNLG